MKKILTIALIVSFGVKANAADTITGNTADTTKVSILKKDVVKVVDDEKGTKVRVGRFGVDVEEDRDTTRIRVGRKQLEIIDEWEGTRVSIQNTDDFYAEREKRFRGHWAGFDLGVNGFTNEDYSAYGGDEFMELDMSKSLGVNLNFLQYDIGLQKNRNTIGVVTGLGLEWNNYRFDRKITIVEGETGLIEPEALDPDWSVKKSKLTTLYLTMPVLLEFQIPVRYHSRRVSFSAGVVGGLRISSHTKVKYRDNGEKHKNKDHDDFNLRTLRYAAQVRLGFRSIKLFATYGLTELFEDNKGPELTPYTVGLTLVSF